jgi:hypothetical protein
MSGGEETLNIDPEKLARLSGQAASMAASSSFGPLATPAPTVTSLLDVAAVALSSAIQAMVTPLDTADSASATEQATMLAESPPVLVATDQQGADSLNGVQFPTPVTAPAAPGQVFTT